MKVEFYLLIFISVAIVVTVLFWTILAFAMQIYEDIDNDQSEHYEYK